MINLVNLSLCHIWRARAREPLGANICTNVHVYRVGRRAQGRGARAGGTLSWRRHWICAHWPRISFAAWRICGRRLARDSDHVGGRPAARYITHTHTSVCSLGQTHWGPVGVSAGGPSSRLGAGRPRLTSLIFGGRAQWRRAGRGARPLAHNGARRGRVCPGRG